MDNDAPKLNDADTYIPSPVLVPVDAEADVGGPEMLKPLDMPDVVEAVGVLDWLVETSELLEV